MSLPVKVEERLCTQFCLLLQVPTVVPEAKKALSDGCAVVIGLQTTGEAAADALGLEPGQACGWVSTTREMLRRFVEAHFPVLRENAKSGAWIVVTLHSRGLESETLLLCMLVCRPTS